MSAPASPSGRTRKQRSRREARITIGILCLILGYVAFRIAGPYFEALLTGGLLAVLFYPLHVWFLKHIKSVSLSALLVTTIAVVTVLVPMALIITTVIRELRQGIQDLAPSSIGSKADHFRDMIDSLAVRFGSSAAELGAMARARLQEAVAAIVKGTVSIATSAGSGIISMIVAIGALHFCLYNGEWLHRQILAHSPLGRARTRSLIDTVHSMITASFYGVVAVAASQGGLLGLAAWAAGLPIPAVWGIATAACSVIPIVGSALVWIPGTIVLLVQGKTGIAIGFLIWGALVVANADNFVRPLIVMSSLPVSGLLVFIAILGGMQAFGMIGLFIGPVTLAVGIALLKMLAEEVRAAENEESGT
jgi:predicted PurR-regulated permease PerM